MAISVGNYSFEGPYASTNSLENKSGVYLILCHFNSKYYLIDVGESATVKTRIENHDRSNCWQKNCKGKLIIAVHYTPNKQKAGRIQIEQELRQRYNAKCGNR
jgi:hypothetical protein